MSEESSSPEERIEAFFAGVDAMRAFLNRHSQTSTARQARLQQLALQLLQPSRGAAADANWFVTRLHKDLGARHCGLFTRASLREWAVVASAGDHFSVDDRVKAIMDDVADVGGGRLGGSGIWMARVHHPPALLLTLLLHAPLAAETEQLLVAIAEQFGSIWERAQLLRELK